MWVCRKINSKRGQESSDRAVGLRCYALYRLSSVRIFRSFGTEFLKCIQQSVGFWGLSPCKGFVNSVAPYHLHLGLTPDRICL